MFILSLLRSKCFPGASYHHIQICHLEVWDVCQLSICWIRFGFVHCLLLHMVQPKLQLNSTSESVSVFGIRAVLIAGECNSKAFTPAALFISLQCQVSAADGRSIKFLVGFQLKHLGVGVKSTAALADHIFVQSHHVLSQIHLAIWSRLGKVKLKASW